MKPSHRISNINAGGSNGWDIYLRAMKMRNAGQQVTMLTIGDHDQVTPSLILDAMDASARGGNTGYPPIPGSDALRAAIAAKVTATTGVAATSANVLVTPGAQSGLFSALTATLDPGEAALHFDPHYATYTGTIRSASGQPVPVPARPENGFQPTLADLDAAPAAKALLMNSPNNPTGVVYSRATLETIAGFVKTRDMWLISDEVYETQVWEGEHFSPRALPDMAERTLVIGSLSKSHIMTGFRLGWVIGPEPIIGAMAELSVNTTYGVPGFIQDAGLVALTQGDALAANTSALYARRRSVALSALRGRNGVGVVPNAGSMFLMLDIRATGQSGLDFADELLDKHKIAVMPGESFGRAAAGHLRVALTVEEDVLASALTTLADFVEGKL